jgi:hypothetical protein
MQFLKDLEISEGEGTTSLWNTGNQLASDKGNIPEELIRIQCIEEKK